MNSAALRDVAYGDGSFVSVGDKGLILQSGPVFSLNWIDANTLSLDGEIDRTYRIQALDITKETNWTDVLTITNTSDNTAFSIPASGDSDALLYRAATD